MISNDDWIKSVRLRLMFGRFKENLPGFLSGLLWLFLVWIGMTALERNETQILGIYVLIASTAVACAAGWFWKNRN